MSNLKNNNEKEESLLFLHIPKAGGSTLTKILDRQYQQEEICKIHEKDEVAAFGTMPESQKKQFKVIKGHFDFGLHEDLLQKCSYMTMLREPTERMISYYYYICSHPKHPLHKPIVSNQMTLEEFVTSGISKTTDNGQTRFISGQRKVNFGSTSQEMLAIAKDNLHKMTVVGTLESFDETLILIKKAFGWKNILYTKQNITRKRLPQKEIPQSTLETIVKYSKLDQELYSYAQSLLEQQIAREQPSFAFELATFKLCNKGYRAYHDIKAKIKALIYA